MKKFIAIVLLFAMCLSLFACKKDDEGASEGLKKAQEFVRSSYMSDSVSTPVDIKLMGVTRVDNVEYQVEWSASSDKITFTREDKFVTLHVPNDNLEDIEYVLTATVSDGDNSLTVEFQRKVPARAGIPTELADGTYVIVNGNLTFSSLDESKNYGYAYANEVTITDGAVSGHFKADVLTIKNVDGGFTIQDAYGRYVYLKGTYNSFNVGKDAPEEGHIWQILANKEGKLFIVNKMNGKTLAYDTSYSSWGCYPELTETRLSEVAIFAATAPDADPEKPDVPDVPEVPGDGPEFIASPEVGVGYKFGFYQANLSKYLYFTGAMSGNFYAMSDDASKAVDVYLENAEGGYYFYFLDGETKTYLSLEGYEKDGKQRASVKLTAEATTVFAYSEDAKTYVSTVGTDTFYLGTYNTFETISASSTYYITGEKANTLGVSQFAADFCKVTITEKPDVPDVPEVPADTGVEVPVAGNAYKLALIHGGKGDVKLFFTGATKPNYPWYMTSTDVEAQAIDVYVEEVDGGLRLYFTIDGTKTYLDMHKDGTHYSLRLTTEPTAVYTWNTELKTLVATVEDKECFIGTSGNYDTFSCNKMEYVDSSYVAHLYGEGGTAPVVPEDPTDPTDPTDPVPGESVKPADVTLTNGMKVVIYAPGEGKAISSVATGFNLSGVDVNQETAPLSGYGETEIWTVIVNEDGSYSFECGGQKMGMQDEYASISMGAVNDKWEVISLGDGLYNLKNIARQTYVDWYSGKWSTYANGTPATDPAFQLAFYVVE